MAGAEAIMIDRDALMTWLRNITQLNNVNWEDQPATYSFGPSASLSFVSIQQFGVPDVMQSFDPDPPDADGDLTPVVASPQAVTVTVAVESPASSEAMAIAADARARVWSPSARAILASAHCGLGRVESVRYVPYAADERLVPRATFDVSLNFGTQLADAAGSTATIETVEVFDGNG